MSEPHLAARSSDCKSAAKNSNTPPSDAASRAPWRTLVLVLALGLGVRVALWAWWDGQPIQIVDAQDYHRLAVGLVETGSYITPSGELSSLRPPLYPYAVSLIYRIFGVGNDAAVRMFQAIVSLFTVLITYQLGSLIYTQKIGLVAATLVCFYPSLLGFNNLLLSESLSTFLLVLSTWLIAKGLWKQSLCYLLLAGLAFGLGALTRSIFLLSIPVLVIYLLMAWRGTWAQKGTAAAVFATAFAVTIAPWSYRNTRVQQAFTLIDVMGGRNAMMGNYEYTPLERSWATISMVTGEKSWDSVLRASHPEVKGMTQGQLDKAAMKYGIRFAIANPWLTTKRFVVRFFNFWQLERTLLAGAQQGLWGDVPRLALLVLAATICGVYALVLFSGIFGLIMEPPVDRRFLWLLLLSIGVPCLVHAAIFAHSRYHLPLMPLLMFPAAAAWVRCQNIWARRHQAVFRLAIACCLVIILGWTREIVFVDLAQATQIVP